MTPQERKTEIRARLAARRRSFAPEAHAAASERIRRRLLERPEWRSARVLAAFHPLGKEPDILALLRLWLAEDRILSLPRVEGPNPGDIRLWRVRDLDRDLVPGALGIREPGPDCVLLSDPLDWIWVPGVAFDHECARLGRGRAYYDALLARVPPGVLRLGLAFDWQMLDTPLPRDPWDQPLDGVVTDRRVVFSARRAD